MQVMAENAVSLAGPERPAGGETRFGVRPLALLLQGSRFELKYIISEPCAQAVREYASSFLVPDEHADPERHNMYPVHSLYLDNTGMDLCQATIHGLKNRFKLRIRFYDDLADSPVFFEIKRRVNDAILKERAAVWRRSLPPILTGHWPMPSDLVDPNDKNLGALQRFCSLRSSIQAVPKTFVSYMREAYVSANSNSVRLTFDRQLVGAPYRNGFQVPRAKERCYPKIPGVVLELKFTERFPAWMAEMVRVFNLQRCSMAKYVACACTLGEVQGTWTRERGKSRAW
jgi:hypothetical protein